MKIESNKKFEFADNYGHFYWYYSDISEHGTLIIHRVTDNDDEIFFSCEGDEAIALLNCLKNWEDQKNRDFHDDRRD